MEFMYAILAFVIGFLSGSFAVYIYHHKLSIAYDIDTIKGDIENLLVKYEQLLAKIP